jgi:hypothetical protein
MRMHGMNVDESVNMSERSVALARRLMTIAIGHDHAS